MITSVSYRKSGSPQPEATSSASGTFVRKSIAQFEPLSPPPKKSTGSFWQNLFRPKSEEVEVSNGQVKDSIPPASLAKSHSSETVNSICSTNSFSFVGSPRKYGGRKKGKRIPLPDDSLSRPPQPATRRKISTLSRLGMKIGLKSKYNLQSCESLHRLNSDTVNSSGVNSLNRSIRKRRAPLPPAAVGGVTLVSNSYRDPESGLDNKPSTSAQAFAHRRCVSEGLDYSRYVNPKSRYHVRGKRKAPPPPNPFGDPDAPEEDVPLSPLPLPNQSHSLYTQSRLASVSENVEIPWRKKANSKREAQQTPIPIIPSVSSAKSSRNSYVEKEVQVQSEKPPSNSLLNHERYVNEEVKAQLALLKSEADASPLRLNPHNQSPSTKTVSPPIAKEGTSNLEMESPTKLAPRPWYKRSSSKSNSSSPSKKSTKPTMMILAKFTDLDREASRIVEEKKRKSAEISYQENAKGLITMFNEFNINQQTVNNSAPQTASSSGSIKTEQLPSSKCSNPTTVDSSTSAIENQNPMKSTEANSNPTPSKSTAYPGKTPVAADEPKKLAVVQPQSSTRKPGIPPLATTINHNINSPAAVAIPTKTNAATPSPLPLRSFETQQEWCCPRCTLQNEYWRSFCDACHFRNSTGSSVQSISTLFENATTRQAEPTITTAVGRSANLPSANPLTSKLPTQAATTSNSNTKIFPLEKSVNPPPCENFLSQFPLKEKLAKEEKLMGMKLTDDPEIEELAIEKLREARVAFFEKKRSDLPLHSTKQNNLATSCSAKEILNKENVCSTNVVDDEALDALLDFHQQLNPNMSGTGPQAWKPLNVQRFRPMLESIVESNDIYGGLNPIYENWNLVGDRRETTATGPETNTFMQNIQMQLQDHIRYFEQLNARDNSPEEVDNMSGSRRHSAPSDSKYGHSGNDPRPGPSSSRGSRWTPPAEEHHERTKTKISYNTPHEKSAYTDNTLAISKLLRDLEWAIAKGDHRLAASLAHDLAMFKVNCVVSKATQQIVIRVYVEDRFMQQGPFQVQVTPSTTLKELKAKIECDWGIPINFQKWILGRKMAEDDNQTLSHYEIANDSMAFLYLVTPGSEIVKLAKTKSNDGGAASRPRQASPGRKNSIEENSQVLSASAVALLGTEDEIRGNPNQSGSYKRPPKSSETSQRTVTTVKVIEAKPGPSPKTSKKIPETKTFVREKFVIEPAQITSTTTSVNVPPLPKSHPPPKLRLARIEFIHETSEFAAEAIVINTPATPACQRAMERISLSEFTKANIVNKPKILEDRLPAKAVEPSLPLNRFSSANANDIVNNNILGGNEEQTNANNTSPQCSNTTPPQKVVQPKPKESTFGQITKMFRSNDKHSNPGHRPPKGNTEKKSAAAEVSSSSEKSSRGRKPTKENVRKVDQGTSIERGAPIHAANPGRNSVPVVPPLKSISPPTIENANLLKSPEVANEPKLRQTGMEVPIVTPEVGRVSPIKMPGKIDVTSPAAATPSSSISAPPKENINTQILHTVSAPAALPPTLSVKFSEVIPHNPNLNSLSAIPSSAEELNSTGSALAKPNNVSATNNSLPMSVQQNLTPPVILKKSTISPAPNRTFVRAMGGIFMSKVSQLVAVAENMHKNSTEEAAGRFRSIPRRTSLNDSSKPSTSANSSPAGANPGILRRNSELAGSSTAIYNPKEGNFNTYKRMIQMMENEDFIRSSVAVECPICLTGIPPGEGITLRDCLHSFCRDCLIGAIQYSEEPQVRCPYRDNVYSCDSYLQEREVKGLVPPDLYDRHLARSVKLAESKMSNTFHCKTNDCTGWCIYEDDVNVFNCPVCKKRNCLTCQAIHERQNCQEYQRQLSIAAETDEDAKSSRLMLEKMISRGEALDCPACHVVLLKKWGCDWVRCSYCKTEICWVTKGFRWGPDGKGDTSGGCKCGINGVRCHPKCTYCH